MSDKPTKQRVSVFISHQWRDKHLADRLANDLGQFAEVWLDIRNLRPGSRIGEQIEAALAKMDLMLLLWTSNSVSSTGVADEIESALRLGLPIIPVTVEHDENGRSQPGLPAEIADIKGFELQHYGMGMARIALHVLELNTRLLPPDAARELLERPEVQIMRDLAGDADVLRYSNVTDREQRGYWVGKASERMAKYVADNFSPDMAETLLRQMEQQQGDADYGILRDKLRSALGGKTSSSNDSSRQQWNPPPPPPPDQLRKRIESLLPPAQADAAVGAVERYIASAPTVLTVLESVAMQTASPAGTQVVNALRAYLSEANDLIPDHLGNYGLIDDAWIIHNTAYRLVESGVIPPHLLPVDPMAIAEADAVVRAIMPPQALMSLTGALMQYLQTIAMEIQMYQPQMTALGHGYQPFMGNGGTWEDTMNAGLLGTGLSV